MTLPAVLIAGTHSGVGKTTVSLAITAALVERGLRVQTFKAGPDFIDAGHLAAMSGRPCRTLDGWMLTRQQNQDVWDRAVQDADVAVVEGMMGLFDGASGRDDAGSTAQLAKWLDLPVLLVIDASALVRSAAAVALGFQCFDSALRLTGVICNRVGGAGHATMLRDAFASVPELPLVGAFSQAKDLHLTERHLGLTTVAEQDTSLRRRDFAASAETNLDLDSLLQRAQIPVKPPRSAVPSRNKRVRIGVAQDAAFCFYYPDNFEWLQHYGAEVVSFSPLHDTSLPGNLDGLYLGGGYPEVHAPALADNVAMRTAIRDFAERDGMIYAECGGMMFLGRELRDGSGKAFPMAGCFDFSTQLMPQLQAIGYREVSPQGLGDDSLRVKGHEFHYSRLDTTPTPAAAAHLVVTGSVPRPEGFRHRRVFASYIHLHFGSNPAIAAALVAACASMREGAATPTA